jgi:hypothetical protein
MCNTIGIAEDASGDFMECISLEFVIIHFRINVSVMVNVKSIRPIVLILAVYVHVVSLVQDVVNTEVRVAHCQCDHQ